MTEREALKLALEALEDWNGSFYDNYPDEELIASIQEILAQPTSGDYALGYSIGFGEGHSAREALAQPEQHQDWCASLTKMLTSMPPKRAPCNCKPKQELVAECKTCGKPMQIPADDCLACERKEQEPSAWMYEFYADMGHKGLAFEEQHSAYNTPLYSTPPQRTWVGLTKEDKWEIVQSTERDERNTVMELVEAKLKEKNT